MADINEFYLADLSWRIASRELSSSEVVNAALARLGDETGIPIVTPPLARLIAAARRVGAVAKPSGAGGGDCGIAFATSSEQADAVRAAWRADGIAPLPLEITPEGARQAVGDEQSGEVPLG